MRLILSLVVFIACCLPTACPAAPVAAAFADPLALDISSLQPFLATLPPDEKAEQLRDWAAFGVRNLLALTTAAELPIRHPALRDTEAWEVSPGRVFPLSAKEWGVIVAPELLADKPLLGGLIDRKNATDNRLPETIALFTYAADSARSRIIVTYAGTIKAAELYTPASGYHTATVNTLDDFNNFIAVIDDLVSIQWRAGSGRLGGRKYGPDNRRAMTVEEIAALYQALNPAGVSGKSPTPPAAPADDIGFSLDQMLNYPALGEDLQALETIPGVAAEAADPAFAALLARHRAELITIGEGLQKKGDLRPFQALRRRYADSPRAAEARFNALLQYIEDRNGFLTARYDGQLQGTSLGMTLFYTDLLAKLALLGYGETALNSVVGFRSVREIKVPKLYWEEYLRRPATRLWFGLRQEGFEFHGDNLLFQPGVTRVYAASHDPAKPGRESRANYQNREFLGWWDTHYDALAAVEPYYHKLDQIQKWSCIFTVLREENSPLFAFLAKVPVRRDLDFESWQLNEPTLAKIKIPFLDRRRYGRTTECLPIFASNSLPLLGRTYQLTGGVSLASRQDILAKMGKRGRGTNHSRALPPENHPAKAAAAAGKATRPGQGAGQKKQPANQPARPTPSAKRNYGAFSAEKGLGWIKLNWTEGPALAPHELVKALVARQEADRLGFSGEEFFSGVAGIRAVARGKESNHYLVKTAASQDDWLYLAVNPARSADYPAQAAADFPAADIFCAKLLSAGQARKLSAGKLATR